MADSDSNEFIEAQLEGLTGSTRELVAVVVRRTWAAAREADADARRELAELEAEVRRAFGLVDTSDGGPEWINFGASGALAKEYPAMARALRRGDLRTEWERVKEENVRFEAWYQYEIAPRFEGAETFVKTVAENVGLMAWHGSLGLDPERALEDDMRRRQRRLEALERGE